ncbi:MAG: c-type cytochrome [Verrucomicrobiales bacterium]
MLGAIKAGDASKDGMTALHIRQMKSLGNAGIDALLAEVWGKVAESSEDAKKAIAKYAKLFKEAPLWAHNAGAGGEVFNRVCATCHALNGKGGGMGPDLAGSWRNGADYFVESIVDPNAVIGEDFQLNIVTKKDGAIISGMFAGENADSVTIRTLAEPITIPKSEIKSRQVVEQSLMPPGLLDTLTKREVIDLLLFLTRPR